MNKVERVARAICKAAGHTDPDCLATIHEPETCDGLYILTGEGHPLWSFYCRQAEAAISETAKAAKLASVEPLTINVRKP